MDIQPSGTTDISAILLGVSPYLTACAGTFGSCAETFGSDGRPLRPPVTKEELLQHRWKGIVSKYRYNYDYADSPHYHHIPENRGFVSGPEAVKPWIYPSLLDRFRHLYPSDPASDFATTYYPHRLQVALWWMPGWDGNLVFPEGSPDPIPEWALGAWIKDLDPRTTGLPDSDGTQPCRLHLRKGVTYHGKKREPKLEDGGFEIESVFWNWIAGVLYLTTRRLFRLPGPRPFAISILAPGFHSLEKAGNYRRWEIGGLAQWSNLRMSDAKYKKGGHS